MENQCFSLRTNVLTKLVAFTRSVLNAKNLSWLNLWSFHATVSVSKIVMDLVRYTQHCGKSCVNWSWFLKETFSVLSLCGSAASVSHSRNYCLISCCHLVVTDHCWGLPAVNICIVCCHVRAWAAEECLIMKDSASFPCMCCKTGFYESVHVQAAVSLILLEGWILKSHLYLLFHFMSDSVISEF